MFRRGKLSGRQKPKLIEVFSAGFFLTGGKTALFLENRRKAGGETGQPVPQVMQKELYGCR